MKIDYLISNEYRKMNTELHNSNIGYGGSSKKLAPKVCDLILNNNIKSLIDYGSGQQKLLDGIKETNPRIFRRVKYIPFDPCVKGSDKLPKKKADLVVCSDVLEHIEPEYLDAVLLHIKSLTKKIFWCYVATHESNKNLPDGRNAHLIIKPIEWWKDYLSFYFPSIKCKLIKWNRFEGIWTNEI